MFFRKVEGRSVVFRSVDDSNDYDASSTFVCTPKRSVTPTLLHSFKKTLYS